MVRRDMIDLSYLGSHSTLLRIGYCYWGANKARVNEPAQGDGGQRVGAKNPSSEPLGTDKERCPN